MKKLYIIGQGVTLPLNGTLLEISDSLTLDFEDFKNRYPKIPSLRGLVPSVTTKTIINDMFVEVDKRVQDGHTVIFQRNIKEKSKESQRNPLNIPLSSPYYGISVFSFNLL